MMIHTNTDTDTAQTSNTNTNKDTNTGIGIIIKSYIEDSITTDVHNKNYISQSLENRVPPIPGIGIGMA